jgi:transposase, IS30 family
VSAHQAEYPIASMCRLLGVSSSGYYAWTKRRPSRRVETAAALLAEIHAAHAASRGTYGTPRIHAELAAKGVRVGRKRVARLMSQAGLAGVSRRKFVVTTVKGDGRQAPDLVERNFTAEAPDRLWVADITYIPTWSGFLYLAVVLDAFSRRVVGWSMAATLATQLVLDALNMALVTRRPKDVIHHSDQGSQGGFKRSSQHLGQEVAMTRRRRRSDRSGRALLFSPGRPAVAGRDEQRRFWAAIAAGMASEDAAVEAGMSQAVGTRLFRKAGGMPPAMFRPSAKPLSGRYLSLVEREEIALLRVQGCSMREVARRLGRTASTISRELRRNAATRSSGLEYRATTAQWHAERSARRPKQAKLALNPALQSYVAERLAGVMVTPSGAPVPGPTVSWKGRRHGQRKDRRWANAWSPEQIAHRLPFDFPDDETMRISHEAIYQTLFVQSRGALRRELTACLRTGRVLRMPRARTRRRGETFISPEIMISQRPAEAADRAVPGHWEGDLILGFGSSAIGTLVERMTRFTLLLHLPRMTDYGQEARVKNGPALAGHGAEAVCDAVTRTIITLPEQLRRSLTWDQGAEMAQHARLKIDAGVQVYFCDPHSPWQRGTNENTNGLLRQYFPKGTDLSMHSAEAIAAVAAALNSRPRKTLAWKTPAEALDQLLLSANKDCVATTA